MSELSRARYAALYGPTVGDRVRLADTDLFIEVTEDRAAGPTPGDEAVFGGGKVIRESMGQGMATRAEGAPDVVITGAVVLDHWGVVKADVGIRDGRIVALGEAVGPAAEDIDATGRLVLPGGIDAHVHLTPVATAQRKLSWADDFTSGSRAAVDSATMLWTSGSRRAKVDRPR